MIKWPNFIIKLTKNKKTKMTNKEYIEKNNISFAEAMKMYDNEKYPCINDWLTKERIEHKFKVGDFIRPKIEGTREVDIVIDVQDFVYIKKLSHRGNFLQWETDDNIGKYYKNRKDIFVVVYEQNYEKIF